jgi:hypothetical protein
VKVEEREVGEVDKESRKTKHRVLHLTGKEIDFLPT